jgi:RNA polymerase sigma factor (sigma-70 family)
MSNITLGQVVRQFRGMAGLYAERSDEELLGAFAIGRDESAFAAIVRRYGGLVMGVCRRALGHEQDAEDAFQATFLVLARSAASIRKGQSLSCWLHGVCHRITLRARRSAARRRKHEGQTPPRPVATDGDPSWSEVQAILDEEVQRLSELYREPLVLCCLEGRSRAEVAALFGAQGGHAVEPAGRGAQAASGGAPAPRGGADAPAGPHGPGRPGPADGADGRRRRVGRGSPGEPGWTSHPTTCASRWS